MPTYHRAFISHAHTDNVICQQYADALRAKGIDVWIDLTNAQQGHDLSEEIARELRERTAFVLMVTRDSNESHWVRQECSAYNKLKNTRATHYLNRIERMILPVRLNDEVPTLFDGIFWVDALNQPVALVVERIATALVIAERDDPPSPLNNFITRPSPPPVNDWEEIGIHGRLYDLGFRGWRVRRSGVEFILPPTCNVAAGSFLMGSADSDKHALNNEKPPYRIPVGAFAIGTFPVTVAEYAFYLRDNLGIKAPSTSTYPQSVSWAPRVLWGTSLTWDMQLQRRYDHPVVCVTWFNARDYAAWLAKTTGQPWRLPTEAEWEKASRWDEAKQQARIYPWGDTFDKTRANTRPNTTESGLGHTTSLGTYPTGVSPNSTQDMTGNVWEWCSDLYNERFSYDYDLSVSEGDGNDRLDARVLRGGSWGSSPRIARAAYRFWDVPSSMDLERGFRVARVAVNTT